MTAQSSSWVVQLKTRYGSLQEAMQFARGDPIVLTGMVGDWHVREWANLFAGAPQTGVRSCIDVAAPSCRPPLGRACG